MKNLFSAQPARIPNDENPPTEFSPADLDEFKRLNDEGIKEMNSKLLEEDPDDYHRRVYQAEILSLPATLIDPDVKSEAALYVDRVDEVAVQRSVPITRALDTFHTEAQKKYPHVQLVETFENVSASRQRCSLLGWIRRVLWGYSAGLLCAPEKDGLWAA